MQPIKYIQTEIHSDMQTETKPIKGMQTDMQPIKYIQTEIHPDMQT